MSPTPTPAQRRLAARLRRLRDDAGMSTYDLSKALGWNQTRVSRIERGILPADAYEVEAWASATRAPQAVQDELSDLAYDAWTQSRSWRRSHRGGVAARQRQMGELERSCTALRHFQPEAVPGLLQSPSYARHVLAMADIIGRGDIDQAVAARMDRQQVLREPGRTFEYVLAEGALRWRPGPAEVMGEQRDHLLNAARLAAVSIAVIPFARQARAPYIHPFIIYDIPDAPMVLTEQYGGEDEKWDAREVALYERVFGVLRESALHGDAALDFIRAVLS